MQGWAQGDTQGSAQESLRYLQGFEHFDGEGTRALLQVEEARMKEALKLRLPNLKGLADWERRAVGVLIAKGPMKGQALADAVHREWGGGFRQELAALVRHLDFVEGGPDGYSVTFT